MHCGNVIAQTDTLQHNQKSGIGLDSILNAVSRHPELRMKSADIEAARRRISMRSTLMDPMLMIGVQNLPTGSLRFDKEMMTSKMIGVTQTFPFFGKLSTERSLAEQEVHTGIENSAEIANRLRRDVKIAFYDIYHLQKSVATNESHMKMIAELINLSEHSLTIGKSTQQDVLSLKLEKAATESSIIDEAAMINMRLADLSGASNLEITEIQYDDSLDLPAFPFRIEYLDSLSAVHRPALLALSSQTEQAKFEIERAQLMKYPDFSVGLVYMQRNAVESMVQSDMISAQVSFNLPVFSGKLNDAVAEQEAMRTGKQEEIRVMKLEIHSMLGSLLNRMEGIRKQHKILEEEILPLSDMSLSTSRINFQNNKATLNEVLRSEIAILHRLHEKYQLRADYLKAIAQIEYLTGMDFTTR